MGPHLINRETKVKQEVLLDYLAAFYIVEHDILLDYLVGSLFGTKRTSQVAFHLVSDIDQLPRQ